MANATLDVIINSKGATQGASEAGRAADSIKSSFVNIAAKAFVAERAIAQIWAQATAGARFEETMARLNRQMGAFNSTSQIMVNRLDAISQGTLSIDKAATMASRALSVGLDPSQIETFTQAAMLLKNVMGTELPEAFDQIVQSAISGRAAVLGNIGIYIDLDQEVRKLAVSTNRTTEQITKQEKVMLTTKAVIAQLAGAQQRLSDGTVSDADKLDRFAKGFDRLTLAIGTSLKTAVIDSIDWLGRLGAALEHLKPSNMAAEYIRLHHPSGEMFGPPSPGNLGISPSPAEPLKPMPTALRGGVLEAEFARQDQLRQGELDRTKAFLDATARLYETDVQLQIRTAEEVVTAKGALLLQELAKTGETLSMQLAAETEFYAQRKKIGFDSTEERISEETRHKDKVVEITQSLLTNAQAFGIQSKKNTAEEAIARNTAEAALGERLTGQGQSRFAISETQRQEEMQAMEVYYQGLADLANAGYASDAELARKERELLREQLAFRLRLTTEQADKVLFLRKAGRAADAAEIAGSGDPTLSGRTVEGLVDTATAKDILAMERANDDFFAGWTRGLRKYSQDRDSAFGLSVDMARRTAAAMEQGFQTFFFDVFEGRIASLKDMMKSLLDFTKRIIAQIVAQLITVGIIRGLTSAFGGPLTGIGTPAAAGSDIAAIRGFASGGSFTVGGAGGTDSQRIGFMATPGERVSIAAPGQRGGGGPISISITVNATGGQQVNASGATPNFAQLARDLGKLVESKLIEEQRPGGLLAGGTA